MKIEKLRNSVFFYSNFYAQCPIIPSFHSMSKEKLPLQGRNQSRSLIARILSCRCCLSMKEVIIKSIEFHKSSICNLQSSILFSIYQPVKNPAAGHQFHIASLFGDTAVFQHQYAVRVLDVGQPMGQQQYRPPLGKSI
jgi:hypothetical protein